MVVDCLINRPIFCSNEVGALLQMGVLAWGVDDGTFETASGSLEKYETEE